MCAEPTFEGLCRSLAEGQPSIGIFAAEGGLFIGGYGMANATLRTAARSRHCGTAIPSPAFALTERRFWPVGALPCT